MQQINRCFQNRTDFGGSRRFTDKYIVGYEFDLSVFKDTHAAANGVAVKAVYGFILSIIGINGVPEAIVAGVLTALIGRTLMKKNMKERLGFTHGFSD